MSYRSEFTGHFQMSVYWLQHNQMLVKESYKLERILRSVTRRIQRLGSSAWSQGSGLEAESLILRKELGERQCPLALLAEPPHGRVQTDTMLPLRTDRHLEWECNF